MIRLRSMFLGLLVILTAASLRAQTLESFGIGASVGLVTPVDREFRLENFKTTDANVWLQYQAQENIVLRGTFGSLKVNGHNAGQVVGVSGAPITLPTLRDRIDYGTVSSGYEFRESGWTSSLFAGVGGYKINPDPVDAAITNYRDKNESVWGFHFGVDADFRILQRLSLLARIEYHLPQSHPKRQIVTANAGLLYRF